MDSYREYLMTQHWRVLRIEVYHKAGGECTNCGKHLTNNFVCHHVSTGAYRRIGRERLSKKMPRIFSMILGRIYWRDDVVAVCIRCHDGKSEQHVRLHEGIRVPYWARRG